MMARRITWLAPAAFLLFVGCTGADRSESMAEANPCAANPCAGEEGLAARIRQGDQALDSHGKSNAQLIALGAELWTDASLSGAGATSCGTCHTGDGTAMMNETFASPYPHFVQMGRDRAGMDELTAAEMVQLCIAIPMAADPLDYDSEELAALTAYTVSLQDGFEPSAAANPCAANPCGG